MELASSCWYLVRSGSIYRVFCLSCCCWRSGMDMFGYPLLLVSRAAEALSYLLVIWYDPAASTERFVCLVVGDLVWTCLDILCSLSRERPRHGASVFLLVSGTIRQHLPSVLFVLLLLAIWYGHVWISFARCLASGRRMELASSCWYLVRSGSIYRVFCLSCCCWRSGMDMFGYPLLVVSRAAEAWS